MQTVSTPADSREEEQGGGVHRGGRIPRAVRAHAAGLESLLALVLSFAASFAISARLLEARVISDDALVHQYWMWNFRDPELFTDPLTHALRESQRYPEGYVNLFRLAVEFTGPITFGEVLGIALMAISTWLVFLITREQTDWRPGPWIAAAVFLSLINIHRFNGGFPRAFVHPVVLATVLLAMRGRLLVAAVVAGAGTLFYPPAALLAVGVLLWCAIDWHGWRPAISRLRAPWALLALAIAAAGVFVPELLGRDAPAVFTGGRGAPVPRVQRVRSAALLQPVADRLPEAEPQRLRPQGRRQHARAHRHRAAARPARQPPPAAARGARAPGRLARRLHRGAARAVPALPPAPLHVPADGVLRDRHRGHAAPDVDRPLGAPAAPRARRRHARWRRSRCTRWRASGSRSGPTSARAGCSPTRT